MLSTKIICLYPTSHRVVGKGNSLASAGLGGSNTSNFYRSARSVHDCKGDLHAPFFNIYEDGKVCMGTVTIDIKNSASVEEFTHAWESYFFDSYFSHLLGRHSPIKGNCVHVWKDLIGTDKPFPKEALKKNNRILKNLL